MTDTAALPARRLDELPRRMHHHAFVVRDQGATRQFYEGVLGIPLVATWCEVEDVRGKVREYCHTFYGLGDGSALAFFQFAEPADYEELASYKKGSLGHIALSVDAATQADVADRLEGAGVGHRVVDHGYCRSLYVVDPDGLTVEFTVDAPEVEEINQLRRADAHQDLDRWLAGDHRPNNDWRAEHH
jgi:glyoxylase I family protein